MKDSHYVLIFGAIGLILAFAVSKPLRRPPESMPRVGTPLRPMADREKSPAETQVYAEGTISLGRGLSAQDAANKTLFIIARPAANGAPAGGPPLAVKRFNASTFPLTFSLTNANNMIGTDFYDGDLTLLVRLDADGMAGPKQPEDIETSVSINPKKSREIQITLSR